MSFQGKGSRELDGSLSDGSIEKGDSRKPSNLAQDENTGGHSSVSSTKTTFSDANSSKSGKLDEEEMADSMLLDDPEAGNLKRINLFFKRQARNFTKNFIDYGPPYSKTKPFDVALINECARPRLNTFELHKLLNKRLNPNIPDPEDLYFTPIHWCARNAHLLGMKMLRKAGAKVNVTNEMGVTPLDLAVMMKHPPDRRSQQIKSILYLLKEGALVNTRDKGGFGPIDHAAANQDAEVIEILLEHGATVMRENHTLVAKRRHILRNVHDNDCYRLLYAKLQEEEAEAERKRLLKESAILEIQRDEHKLHLLQSLEKKKIRKQKQKRQDNEAKMKEDLAESRARILKQEMENGLETKKQEKIRLQGVWKKDMIGNWIFSERDQFKTTTASLYNDSLSLLLDLKEKNDISNFNTLWRRVTAGGELEVKWQRSKPFRDALLMDHDARKLNTPSKSVTTLSNNLNKSESTSILSSSDNIQSNLGFEESSIDHLIIDDRESELDSEDLDSLLAELRSLGLGMSS